MLPEEDPLRTAEEERLAEEVLFTDVIAFPEHGRIRGTVLMLPYSREKSLCGSLRLYSPEVMASILGYVTLIPDDIGYGSSDSLAIAYQMCENSAIVASHLQEAAGEYFAQYRDRKLPAVAFTVGRAAPPRAGK